MIRKSNGSGRRILNFPAVHPCENIALPTLLASLITLSQKICSFSSKCRSFPCNKRNARTTIRFVEVLRVFLEEIRDQQPGLPGSVLLSLSELHFTFQKLLFLLEDSSREGARLWMLMESGRVATMFRALSGSVATALDVFPLSSFEGSVEAKEQVELVMKQARKARFEIELDDQRAMMGVQSILKQFERKVVPSEGDLKWVLDYIGVRGWKECNKEVEFLKSEIGFEQLYEERGKVGFLCSLMGFMSYCRCVVVEELVDGEEGTQSSNLASESLMSCFKFDDFLCPISLELMTDPVTIETGHTYDRSSILKWFRSGNHICPQTGKKLNSIELVPNSALQRVIHQYCSENGVPVPDPGHRNGDIKRTGQPGSLAAEEIMKMISSFLTGRLENGTREEKIRAAYEIQLLSKSSIFNRSCLVDAGSIPSLLKLLTWRDSSSAQENAVAALLNLSKHHKGRSVMVQNGGLKWILGVLNKGLKIQARQYAAAILFYLASNNEEYGKMIGENPDAIPSLIRLIKDGSNHSMKSGLVAMFGLLIHPNNHRKVLSSGAVPLLVNIIKTSEKEDLVTDSLVILATLAEKSSDGTKSILHYGALHVAIEILSSSSTSRVGKEHCVSLLLSLSINGGVDVVAHLVKSPSLMGSLYSQLSEGTSQASKKASALIRILHDFYERRSSGFKTSSSVLPQEQFIHVW